jgi:hypothetical protein
LKILLNASFTKQAKVNCSDPVPLTLTPQLVFPGSRHRHLIELDCFHPLSFGKLEELRGHQKVWQNFDFIVVNITEI